MPDKAPINITRWQNKLRAMMGMRGANPIPDLEALKPVVVIEDDRMEWGYAGAEFYYSNEFESPAAAAQLSYGVLVNPVGSGLLGILEGVIVEPAQQYSIFGVGSGEGTFAALAATARGAGTRRDRRLRTPSIQRSGLLQGQSSTAVAPLPAVPPVRPIPAAGLFAAKLLIAIPPRALIVIARYTLNLHSIATPLARQRAVERPAII